MFCVIENSENESANDHMFYECVDQYYADALEGFNIKPYFTLEYKE